MGGTQEVKRGGEAWVIATSDFRACFIVLGGCSAKSCLLLLSPVVVIMFAPIYTEKILQYIFVRVFS